MKLSISNIAWSAADDAEMLAFLRDVGFAGLEIAPTRVFPERPYDRLGEASEWSARLAAEYGLEVPSLQSMWYGRRERVFGTADERAALLDYTRRAILFAEVIGCRNLVFGNPKNRDTDNPADVTDVAVDFFREIGGFAAAHNTVVALEPNPPIYNTRFMNRTDEAVAMARLVDSDGIKVNVDFGAMIANGESVACLADIPEYINHVHISEPFLVPIERRDGHRELFRVLRDMDYAGYVSVEMAGKAPLDRVKRTVEYIRKLADEI